MASDNSNVDEFKHQWLLDSACSRHITNDRSSFTTYQESNNVPNIVGVGGDQTPQGEGQVTLSCNNNGKKQAVILNSVLYLPSAPASLISYGQLIEYGAQIKTTIQAITATKGSLTLIFLKRDSLYALYLWGLRVDIHACTAYALRNLTMEKWHNRLGHMGEQNLIKLVSMSTGINLNEVTNPDECVCEPCILGRMKSSPHNGHIQPGNFPMDLIHSDVAGPLQDIGPGGQRYWITFLDDFTKMSEVYAIIYKSEAFECFRHFKNQYERGAFRITRFRTDGGGEYMGKEFQDFLWDNGITWESTTPGYPQQNGAAESLNNTLITKLYPTLLGAGLSNRWWPEVLQTVNYLRNRSPESTINKTPYEAYKNMKPNLRHLRTIGSRIYTLKRLHKQKLVEKCTVGVLVGYEGDRIYRVLTPEGKIVRSSNAHIDEKLPKPLETTKSTDDHPSKRKSHPSGQRQSPNAKRNTSPAKGHCPVSTDARIYPITDESEDEDNEDPPPLTNTRNTASHPSEASSNSSNAAPDASAETLPEASSGVMTRARTKALNPTERTGQVDPNYRQMVEVLQNNPQAQTELRRSKCLAETADSSNLFAMISLASHNTTPDPQSYSNAIRSHDRYKWEAAMKDEYSSLMSNHTWTLVQRPDNRAVLGGRWVFRTKRDGDGNIVRHKARWVVRGFEQREGIDYHETFASVVKPMSYKALFAIAAAKDSEIEQMDVKTAFLYGTIDEIIYMEQPTGMSDQSTQVCQLQKAIYGLKQSPRIWYQTLSNLLQELGFQPLHADESVFARGNVIIAIYVDDLPITGPLISEIQTIKRQLSERFSMTDLGPCAFYLGMTVTRDRKNRIIRLSQSGYIEKILQDFGMESSAPVATPMEQGTHLIKADPNYEASKDFRLQYQSAVGALMYAMLGTRPDIAFSVSVISRHASNPTELHWTAVKRIMRYLRGTTHYHLTYKGNLEALVGFTDSDWAADHDTRRSTSGYIFHLGSGAISWSSKRQATVALSTCEAEYVGQTNATKEAIWLRRLLRQLHPEENSPCATVIYGDNQGAIATAKNPQFHARMKHLDIRHHYVREKQGDGTVQLTYVPTAEQVADGLTKPLPKIKFLVFRDALGLEDLSSQPTTQ